MPMWRRKPKDCMSLSESGGAKGEMQISWHLEEDASTAADTTTTVVLKAAADPLRVRLVTTAVFQDLRRDNSRKTTEEIYEIAGDDLVSLIEKHGKKIRL